MNSTYKSGTEKNFVRVSGVLLQKVKKSVPILINVISLIHTTDSVGVS